MPLPLLHEYDPWEVFARQDGWKLRFDYLPDGTMGETDFAEQTVTLAQGLNQHERRCTIAHEGLHILRGPVRPHRKLAEELTIDRRVARLLLPRISDVVDALIDAGGDYDRAAHWLWIDELTLHVRMSALVGFEGAYVHRRMSEVFVTAAEIDPDDQSRRPCGLATA